MKKPGHLFAFLAIVLSHIMCIVVAYNYRDALCAIEHGGFSAPAEIVFLYAVPFVIGIVVCIVLAAVFYKKSK